MKKLIVAAASVEDFDSGCRSAWIGSADHAGRGGLGDLGDPRGLSGGSRCRHGGEDNGGGDDQLFHGERP